MQNPPFVPLSRKKFTSQEFERTLQDVLSRKKKKVEDPELQSDEIAVAESQIEEAKQQIPDDDDWLGKANDSVDPKQTKGFAGKALDWATTPMSGDFFQRNARKVAEFLDDPNKEGQFKTTGKGDLQDWIGWGQATAKGAYRGAIEGVGAAADTLTSPADLAATASGFGAIGAATRGAKGIANALRWGTKLASGPVALQGAKGMIESGGDIKEKGFEGFDFADMAKFGMSGVQGVAGLAGMKFPKSALTSRYPLELAEGATAAPSVGAPQGAKQRITKPGGPVPPGTPPPNLDPNYNQGAGDPMLAGSVPAKPFVTPEAAQLGGDAGARLDALYEKIDAKTATQAELQEANALVDQRYDAKEAAKVQPKAARGEPETPPSNELLAELETESPTEANFLKGLKFPEKETFNPATGEIINIPKKRIRGKFSVNPKNMSGPQLAGKVMDSISARPEIPPVDSISSQKQEIDANGLEMERLHQESEQMRSGPEYTATGAKIRELALRNKALWAEIDATSNVPAAPPVDELAALKTRKDVLAAKHNRTGRFEGGESAEFNALGDKIKNFMGGESGELNVDAFLGEYEPTVGRPPVDIQRQPNAHEFARMGDELLTNTSRIPTGSRVDSQIPKPRVPVIDAPARSFPKNTQPTAEFAYENKPGWGDEGDSEVPLKLYRVTGGELDGSDVSAQTLLDNGIAVPDQAPAQPQHKMPNEFMPDMRQVDEFMPDLGPDARTSRYEQQVPDEAYVPPAKASMGDKIRNFMREDSGELDVDPLIGPERQLDGDVELYRGEHPDNDWMRPLHKEKAGRYFTTDKERANKIYAQGAKGDEGTLLTTKVSSKDLPGYRTADGQYNEYLLPEDVAAAARQPEGFAQRFKKTMSDEQGSVPRKDPTAQHYQARIDELDAKGAPDTEYRDALSTGGRETLKKGQTWRQKLNQLADYLDRNNPESKYHVAEEVPDSITTAAAIPEQTSKLIRPGKEPLSEVVPEAPLAAQVDLSKLKFKGGERKPKVVKEEAPGDSTLAYGQPGSSKRSAIPARKPGESPIAAAKRVAQEEIPETAKTHPVGSAAESENAEALFGRGNLDELLKEYLIMARRNAKDPEFQRLIPESLRKSTDADGNPSFELAAGETWRKKASTLIKAAQEHVDSKAIPMSEEGSNNWDPEAFNSARDNPEIQEAIRTIRDLEKRIPDTKDPDAVTGLKGGIERQHTVISRALSKIKNFMGEDSGEIDADFGKPKVHEPQLVDEMPSSLKSSKSRIAAGEKIVEWDQTGTNMLGNESVLVRNLNGPGKDGYTTPATAHIIEDTARMSDDRIRRNNDPEFVKAQKAKSDDWNRIQDNLEATSRVEKQYGRGGGKLSEEDYHAAHAKELTGVHSERGRTPAMEGETTPQKRLSGIVKNFMSDESGGVNNKAFEGFTDRLLGKPKEKKTEYPKSKQGLKSFDQLKKGVEITERPPQKVEEQSMLGKAKDVPKAMMSVDLPYITSAAFRQTKPLAWSTEWFKAWGKAAEAYGDEAASSAIMKGVTESKNFRPQYKPKINSKGETIGYKEMPSRAETVGVHLSGSKFLPGEEQVRSQLAEKLPWVKASNRAYSTFINHMRQTKLDEMLDLADSQGIGNNLDIGKQIGDYVNTATGRGSLKWEGPGGRQADLERLAPFLQNTMWAPRLLAANSKFLNPWTYINADPLVRGQYAAGALRMAGTWAGFAGLAHMAGADVSLDPTSSDFGKIKIGDIRIDPAGGMQQLIVFLARQAPGSLIGNETGKTLGVPTGSFMSSGSGKRRQYGEGAFPVDRASVAEDFATSKLDPVTRLAYELMRSSSKRPVHLTDKAVQMALPIMAQDIHDAMKEDPSLERLLGSSFSSSAGMGVNTYGKNERFSDPVFTDSIESALGMKKRSLAGSVTAW